MRQPNGAGRPSASARPLTVLDGRKIDGRFAPVAGEFTYSIVTQPAPASAPGEKRGRPRQRTRLRTGKIITMEGRFLADCLVFDRSESGSRLRLPAPLAVRPPVIQFYDDQNAVLHQADIVWRAGREIGVRFRPSASTPQSRALAAAMRRRFYAITD